MKYRPEERASKTLRDVFLNFIAQHYRIVTFCAMWHLERSAKQSLSVLEWIFVTIASALKQNGNEVDKASVLRYMATAFAQMHDQGTVHGDMRTENCHNDQTTSFKLSYFGIQHRS